MPERIVNEVSSWNWADKTFWSVVGLFMLGHFYRTLTNGEPFNLRKFLGEMIGAFIGAIIMYSTGIMNGMTEVQIILFGSLGSLGGIRTFEWAIKIYARVRNLDSIK